MFSGGGQAYKLSSGTITHERRTVIGVYKLRVDVALSQLPRNEDHCHIERSNRGQYIKCFRIGLQLTFSVGLLFPEGYQV